MLVVNLASIRGKFFGESERNIKRLFEDIEMIKCTLKLEPIVLFNEADGFFHDRNQASNTNLTETNIVTMFLNELEKYEGLMIATCNSTASFDKAFERRWIIKVNIPPPSFNLRQILIQRWFGEFLNQEETIELSRKYEFTPGQIVNVFKRHTMLNITNQHLSDLSRLLEEEIFQWKSKPTQIGFSKHSHQND